MRNQEKLQQRENKLENALGGGHMHLACLGDSGCFAGNPVSGICQDMRDQGILSREIAHLKTLWHSGYHRKMCREK